MENSSKRSMTLKLKATSRHNLGTVPPPATETNNAGKTVVHKSLYWSHDAQVLFTGWPGADSAMYALAVIFVFVLAVLVEWLTYCNFMKQSAESVSKAVLQTAIHAVRTGLSYMVMLSVMSFNGGIFLAAVGGHAVGFVLFRARAKRKSESDSTKPNGPISC
ncbi:copper transporter 4 [Momordica charantia]|uniref:Copper transport protein n=1 Tax=Momordica charantia TaxID=3673 RepID=A0A6J1CV92_MOMCH|nr:copper transporter 4 [Momordica charantia]